jgi:Family of unknown function (DUF6101)
MRAGGATSAGSSRFVRLDPFALPVSFAAHDAAADERVRFVELHRRRVVVRRAVRGIRMALNLPVNSYLGVAIRMLPPQAATAGAVAVILAHRDPALSLPLSIAPDGDNVIAEWQSWARVLALPLLVTDDDGGLHDAFPRLGQVWVAAPTPRRRRRNAIKRRRPSILLRRRPGRRGATPVVYRGEREIIARN